MDTPGRQEEFALDLDLGDLDIVESNKFWTRVSHPSRSAVGNGSNAFRDFRVFP